MPRLIRVTDFWLGFDPRTWAPFRLLREKLDLEVAPTAGLLVCGPYGRKHIRHIGTKILWTPEAWPYKEKDYDYVLGFATEEGNRSLRFPNFVHHLIDDALDGIERPRPTLAEWRLRPRFCNFIYSNGGPTERLDFFNELARRREIAAPGPVCNNEPPIEGGNRWTEPWRAAKVRYQSNFRFSIAFENTRKPGYTTEKLIDALAAGTIPIYWGNPLVSEDVDPAAFINADAFSSLEQLAEYVCAVDEDDSLAASYLAVQEPLRKALRDWTQELIAFFDQALSTPGHRVRQTGRSLRLLGREAARTVLN